jgi:hypothetical protein
MLVGPLLVAPATARSLAAPVFLGFIFLLDPINAWLGGESLLQDPPDRRYDRLVNLAASGALCGVLWEFWNYWSRAKWHYTVPIMQQFKLFEMPLAGYLGFPAFAIECFTMYVFVRSLFACAASALRRAHGVPISSTVRPGSPSTLSLPNGRVAVLVPTTRPGVRSRSEHATITAEPRSTHGSEGSP